MSATKDTQTMMRRGINDRYHKKPINARIHDNNKGQPTDAVAWGGLPRKNARVTECNRSETKIKGGKSTFDEGTMTERNSSLPGYIKS